MKIFLTIAALTFSLQAPAALAATDRGYYIAEATTQQNFDVFNDGRNTYIEAMQGLVITGATVDSMFFIVNGLPTKINGFMNGKPISIVRGSAPPAPAAAADKATIAARIAKLTADLNVLAQGAAKRSGGDAPAGPAAAPAATPADVQASWRIAASDGTLRELTSKWAASVGWKAIWEVDRDIPIDSPDEMRGDFRAAVRYALSATEFADVKVKPCFYTNRVVRITFKTTECNPAK
jgi:hypothetical protein